MQTKKGLALVLVLPFVALAIQPVILVLSFRPEFYDMTWNLLILVSQSFDAVSYIILSMLLIREVRNLEEFHIDKYTIMTFVLFSLLRPRYGVIGEDFFLILIGLSGIATMVTVVVKKPEMPKTNIRWAVSGMAIASTLLFFITYVQISLRPIWELPPLLRNSIPLTSLSQIIRDISSSALLEELMFRGFLWGYLRRSGWGEKKIFWWQSLLFWLGHLSRIITPFSFFFIIPTLTFISSKLTYQSKQIFPAIIFHTILNSVSAMLNLATF